eukprot:11046628-Alexandrium_andersonii.AAC.1
MLPSAYVSASPLERLVTDCVEEWGATTAPPIMQTPPDVKVRSRRSPSQSLSANLSMRLMVATGC